MLDEYNLIRIVDVVLEEISEDMIKSILKWKVLGGSLVVIFFEVF